MSSVLRDLRALHDFNACGHFFPKTETKICKILLLDGDCANKERFNVKVLSEPLVSLSTVGLEHAQAVRAHMLHAHNFYNELLISEYVN